MLEKHIGKYANGKVLDMGTGSSILAQKAAETADNVLAVDISQKAIASAPKNKKIQYKQSDLFSNVKEKFDLIIFNPPYLPQDKNLKDPALYGGKKGYEILVKFLNLANDYLANNGTILILFSSLTNKEIIDQTIKDNLYTFDQIDEQSLFFEQLYVYEIKKTELLKKLEIVKQIELFAKGHRGLVYKGNYKNKLVAVKIKNPKSKAINTIPHEAMMLEKVNKLEIGPKLIIAKEDYLIMEFIDGELILDYLEEANKKQRVKTIKKIFDQLYKLDQNNINKEEMHHPVKHIIIQSSKPILIDFERARYTEKPHNVTQFCQFLINEKVCKHLDLSNNEKNQIIDLAKNYKKTHSNKFIDSIVNLIN